MSDSGKVIPSQIETIDDGLTQSLYYVVYWPTQHQIVEFDSPWGDGTQ